MYHHRYQPPPHLANKNATAFASNNYSINSSSASSNTNTKIATTSTSSSAVAHQNNNTNSSSANNIGNSSAYSSAITKQFVEERQDVIFRKVRGILNKITPETFDKLSKELVNVGLDSPRTLRGVIYLLFDKALKDLKYSSLYAKLCQELSEKAPNFEQESGPNTFCKFLISKCEDEFERRRKATEDFDGKNELTDEEYEQKAIAKQKMLGNIKFICELGKKRLLQEEILHECIRGLLSKKKERPIPDQAQDLECLCQIMRTIGSLLDIQASRNLMNQYFERIDMFSKKPELPSRIRFMLRDVIDLRNNNWRPRPFQREDNVPQPLSKLREEAGYDASQGAQIDKLGNNKNLIGIGDLSKLHGSKLSSLLLDDEPSFTTSTDFHWGPTFLPHDSAFDVFSSSVTTFKSSALPAKPTSTTTTTVSSKSNTSNSTQKSSLNQVAANHMTNLQQRIDPFSDSFKARFNYSRQPIINNNSVPTSPHGNNAEIKRFNESRGFDIDAPAPPNMRDEANLAGLRKDRDPSFAPHFRNNNNVPAIGNNSKIQPNREDHMFGGSKRFGDSSRQAAHPRGGNVSPNPRNKRHPLDVPPSSPPSSHPPPTHPFPPPPLHQNQRFDSKNMHGGDGFDNRDRRTNRGSGDHFGHEHRQPRFSGANYRLPGRDKPQPSRDHHFGKGSHQPESELNLNWRSVGQNTSNANTAPTNPQASSNSHVQKPLAPQQPEEQFANSKPDKKRTNDLSPTLKVASHHGDVNPEAGSTSIEKKPFADRGFEPPLSSIPNDRDTSASKNFTGSSQNVGPTHPSVQQRFDSVNPPPPRFYEPRSPLQSSHNNFNSQSSSRSRSRRAHNSDIRPPSIHPPSYQSYKQSQRMCGPNERDFSDRKERDQRRFGHQQDFDKSNAKFSDNESNSHSDRNYRPPISRNQSFDSHHISESNRVSNRRKDASNSATGPNTANPTKDQPPVTVSAINTPLLSKPPTKISDSNFSLRPSHNLVGRALSGPSTQRSSTKQASDSATMTTRETTYGRPDSKVNNGAHQQEGLQNVSKPSSVKAASDDAEKESSGNNTTKDAARDFHVNKFISVLSEYSNESSSNPNRVASKIKELKIPKNYHSECLVNAMKQSIVRTETDRESTSKLLVQLVPSIFDISSLLSAFKVVFEQLHGLEVETPRVKSIVAGFLSRAVFDGLLALEEVGNVLSGGKHHPLFLLFLQKLEKSAGQAWLIEKFMASKINLMDMLPEVDRSKERLASALKDRCLGFLDPMLTIEPDLYVQMRDHDPSPAAVYRWIKDNVDQTIQSTPTFAHVLIACLLRYIHNTASEKSKSAAYFNNEQQKDSDTDGSQSNKSSPTTSSSQSTIDIEKELLTKYQQVLQAILKDKQMQLATLYALQSFYHGLDFPKGALLRWFHMLYDMNIVDDDVFFIWKEEINDEFPGKGQALFQVNTWLNWLAEAESEEEEDV